MSLFASVSFREILQHPFFESLGWTLLHSLWQGTGVAVVLWIVLIALRRASANVRYLASCAALLLLLVMPVITLAFLAPRESSADAVLVSDVGGISERVENINRARVVESTISHSVPSVQISADPPFPISESATVDSPTATVPALDESLVVRTERLLRPWVPGVTMLWCCGVVLMSMRLCVAWLQVERLKNTAVPTADGSKLQLLDNLSERLGVNRAVRLLESSLVEVPTVIGWLKPVILLPIATVNSLTVSQLEAILAHELAHIRRADYVVNLLQSAIETLLFYHPAVWWISSSIRQEREHCCDDLAASISGDKAGYVAALVRMEELRSVSRAVALAARGGNLLVRVRRLLRPPAPDRLSHWWLTGMMTSLIVVSLIALPLRAKLKAESIVAEASTLKNDKKSRKSESRKNEARLAIVEGLDNITPAQIADRIEEAWKRYESIEYEATIEETRNTTAFSGDAKPTLVDGTGKTAGLHRRRRH